MSRAQVGTTLTVRLTLIITLLMALLTIAGGWYVINKAREDVGDEVRSTLSLTGHFLDAQLDVLRDHWSQHGYAIPLFQLAELRDVRHVNIRFISPGGEILDSNEDVAGRRPEAPRWFTALVRMTSQPTKPETRPVAFNGALVGTLVMSADPTYEIDEIWSTSSGLLQLLLAFFVLVNLLVWGVVSRALRPIERILAAFDDLRAGRLATRLPEFNLPEMSRLSVGFNHMAETLERSLNENQRLTRELLNTQETERRNLAHDLHDEIGQCVSAIHADAVAIRNRGGDAVRESAEAIVQVTGQIKENVRSILRRIRPAYLEGLGLESALREQVANFAHRQPDVSCALQTGGDLAAIDGEAGVTVYRVVQESLTNIAMHARARSALVDVRTVAADVHLTVRDDGTGFFQMLSDRGLGLTGIRERVRALGGSCEIESQLGQGTKITVRLPDCVRIAANA
jgi:two-component system, NarL family, sensor histidine kinase UhpB